MPLKFRSVNFIALVKHNNNRAKALVKGKGSGGDWAKAEADEIEKFQEMDVYEVVLIPDSTTVIPTVWVYTYKEDDLKGAIFKARCVVQGFRQIANIHYNKWKILAPVVELTAIRILTAIATQNDYIIHHLDIKLAYLNAPLEEHEQIWVKPPPGHEVREGYCWKLKKAVYGMKQSGYEWFQHLSMKLKNLGFVEHEWCETILIKRYQQGDIYIALYVDDLYITSGSEEILEEFKTDLSGIFDLKYFGEISEYLGIEFTKTKHGYKMSQQKYLKNLMTEFNIRPEAKRRTPLPYDQMEGRTTTNPKTDETYEMEEEKGQVLSEKKKRQFQSGVGSLNWAANNTRPDLAFAVSVLASKSATPTTEDYQLLIRVLEYVQTTIHQHLVYKRKEVQNKGEFNITAFSDASFAPGADARLISGHAIYVNDNLVAWGSKKQKNITKSTAAAELVALSVTEDRMATVRGLLLGLGVKKVTTRILEDNQAVIACCQSKSIAHTRKMVDIKMKEIRERLALGEYTLEYVKSEFNIADMFTKSLSPAKFEWMIRKMIEFRV